MSPHIDEADTTFRVEEGVLEVLEQTNDNQVPDVLVVFDERPIGQIEDRHDEIHPTVAGQFGQMKSEAGHADVVEWVWLVLPIHGAFVVNGHERRTRLPDVFE